jgi:hypothetical protein
VPESEQDRLAEFVLHELSEEERWARTTEAHAPKLKGLVERVLRADAQGGCEPAP